MISYKQTLGESGDSLLSTSRDHQQSQAQRGTAFGYDQFQRCKEKT